MNTDPDKDNTIRAALRKAAKKKRDEREQEKRERRAHLQSRLDALQEKQAGPKPKPGPQRPAWEQEEPPPMSSAPMTREEMTRSLEQIANPTPPRPPIKNRFERSPPVVVEVKTRAVEPRRAAPAQEPPPPAEPTPAPAAAVAAPPTERPLQDSPFPAAYLEMLRTGTPAQILAGRNPKDLKGDERDAYWKAVARTRQKTNAETAKLPRRSANADSYTEVGKLIEAMRFERRWRIKDIAFHGGLKDPPTISQVMMGKAPMTPLIRDGLAKAFGVQPETFGPLYGKGSLTPAVTGGPAHPDDTPLQARLRMFLTREDTTPTAFSLELGLSRDTIPRFLRNPGAVVKRAALDAIAKAMKSTPHDLLSPLAPEERSAAGLPPAADAAPGVPVSLSAVTEETIGEVAVIEDPARSPVPVPAIHSQREEQATPLVRIEKGIPVPPNALVLFTEMFPWQGEDGRGMDIGDSFFAPCPYGMTMEVFEGRFANMMWRQQKKLGQWFCSEPDPKARGVRVWRVL
jgi:hypothetical protein